MPYNKLIFSNTKYMLDLFIRMAHHSTAIEGNTLTQDETTSIILNSYIPRAIKEREFYEVRNYKYLFPHLKEQLEQNNKINNELIKYFHSFIMKDLNEQAGKFKILENAIIGADFETAKPYLVPTLIKDMCDNLYYKINNAKDDNEKLYSILESHIKFEKIHPFSDGNGRTGRLLIIYSCLEQGITPIIIPKEEKEKYISYLRESNTNSFFQFAKEIQRKEKERFLKFLNQIEYSKELKKKHKKEDIER